MSQVPLADTGRRVSGRLQGFRQRDFTRRQPAGRTRTEHARQPGARRKTAGHQSYATRGADRGRRVELGEAHALQSHAVKVRRADGGVTVTTQVAIAEVIGEDDDKVRFIGFSGTEGQPQASGRQRGCERSAIDHDGSVDGSMIRQVIDKRQYLQSVRNSTRYLQNLIHIYLTR